MLKDFSGILVTLMALRQELILTTYECYSSQEDTARILGSNMQKITTKLDTLRNILDRYPRLQFLKQGQDLEYHLQSDERKMASISNHVIIFILNICRKNNFNTLEEKCKNLYIKTNFPAHPLVPLKIKLSAA